MKRITSHYQWVSTLAVSVFLFWLSGHALRLLDPTAGTFDAGYLQVPIVAAAWFFLGISAMFLALQRAFPTVDKYLDDKQWSAAWKLAADHPDKRFVLVFTAAILFSLMAFYCLCLALVSK